MSWVGAWGGAEARPAGEGLEGFPSEQGFAVGSPGRVKDKCPVRFSLGGAEA